MTRKAGSFILLGLAIEDANAGGVLGQHSMHRSVGKGINVPCRQDRLTCSSQPGLIWATLTARTRRVLRRSNGSVPEKPVAQC